MKTRIMVGVLVTGLCTCFLSGCVFVSVDFRDTKDIITRELGPVDIDTEVQLRIGSGMLSLGRLVASCADVDREAMSYLRDIRNVQIGVYKLRNAKRDRPIVIPEKIGKRLARKGYEPMVRTKERDGAVWVMTKIRGKRLEALYVIALDPEELVLVEVRGRLERLIEKAIREHGFERKEFLNKMVLSL